MCRQYFQDCSMNKKILESPVDCTEQILLNPLMHILFKTFEIIPEGNKALLHTFPGINFK